MTLTPPLRDNSNVAPRPRRTLSFSSTHCVVVVVPLNSTIMRSISLPFFQGQTVPSTQSMNGFDLTLQHTFEIQERILSEGEAGVMRITITMGSS